MRSAEARVTADSARTASWQGQIADLHQSLDAKDKAINEQEELLAHDRDIRELMGERDLYISEVYDVDGTGTTRKPYRRVFYTDRAPHRLPLGPSTIESFQVLGSPR